MKDSLERIVKNLFEHRVARYVPAGLHASLAAMQRSAESNPVKANLRNLAGSYEEIGDLLRKARKFFGASLSYDASQCFFAEAATAGDGYTAAQQDILRAKHKASAMHLAAGNPRAALKSEREILAIADPILLANTDDAAWNMFVANVMLFTALAAASLGSVKEASAATERGLTLLQRVASPEYNTPRYQRSLKSFKELKFALSVLPAWAWPPIHALSRAVRLLRSIRI